jgi:hypothetical protein
MESSKLHGARRVQSKETTNLESFGAVVLQRFLYRKESRRRGRKVGREEEGACGCHHLHIGSVYLSPMSGVL